MESQAPKMGRFGWSLSREVHPLPSPEVMPHETRSVAGRHPLALHFVPRSYLSARSLSARDWRRGGFAASAALARSGQPRRE